MVDTKDDADSTIHEGLESGTNRANWREVGDNHARHIDKQERHSTPGAFGGGNVRWGKFEKAREEKEEREEPSH